MYPENARWDPSNRRLYERNLHDIYTTTCQESNSIYLFRPKRLLVHARPSNSRSYDITQYYGYFDIQAGILILR